MTWSINWRGDSWTDDDLTGQHLATLALISGDDRFKNLELSEAEVTGYPSEGYMRLMFMLSAFVVVAACNEVADDDAAQAATSVALTEIQAASADEILGSISFG